MRSEGKKQKIKEGEQWRERERARKQGVRGKLGKKEYFSTKNDVMTLALLEEEGSKKRGVDILADTGTEI